LAPPSSIVAFLEQTSRSTSHRQPDDATEDDQNDEPWQQRLQRISQHDHQDNKNCHGYRSRADVPHLRTSRSSSRSSLVASLPSRRIDRLICRKLSGFGLGGRFSRHNNAATMMLATRTPPTVKSAVITAGRN
jgi:hypothetical protein